MLSKKHPKGKITMNEFSEQILFTPGPANLSASVHKAMIIDYGSRTNLFGKMTRQVNSYLNKIAPDSNLVPVMLQGSGTYAVEAMIQTLIPSDESLLIIINGAYGTRMVAIAEKAGKKYEKIEFPYEKKLSSFDVESHINNFTGKYVAIVHGETTTGVMNDILSIERATASADKLLLIDAMSTFGSYIWKLPIDSSVVSVAASSNKALGGPPGIGIVYVHKSYTKKSYASSLTLDLVDQYESFQQTGEWRFTPPTHVMSGLLEALKELEHMGGVATQMQRHINIRNTIVDVYTRLGFMPLLDKGDMGHAIVTFFRSGWDSDEINEYAAYLNSNGCVIYGGKVSNKSTFRVGCIGTIDSNAIQRLERLSYQYLLEEK